MSNPSHDEHMAHRFYEAMILLVAMAPVAVKATEMALEWARNERDRSLPESDDFKGMNALITVVTSLKEIE